MANYHAVILSNALAFSKEKGTPSVKLQIKTKTNLDNGLPVEKILYADLWLSENAKTRTIETLRAIGFAGNDITELNYPCLVGYEVEISTSFDDYKGNSYEKIDFVNEVGSFNNRGLKSIDDAAAKKLAASLNSVLRNSKNVGKAHISPNANRSAAPAAAAPNPYSRNAAATSAPAAPMAENPAFDDGLPF